MSESASTLRAAWALLMPAHRRGALVLLGLMVIGSVLETLGIGLIVPVMGVVMEGEIDANPLFAALLGWLGEADPARLIALSMGVLVAVYATKNAFLAFLVRYQTRFGFDVQETISGRLVENYLRQPYTFHLQRNSAELIRNAVGETQQLWFFVIGPALIVASEALVLSGLLLLLFAVEPMGASLVVLVVGLPSWVFYRMTNARIARWGAARQFHDGLRIQHLQQGLGGAKEVKIHGVEDEFLARYRLHNSASARVARRQATLQQLPRMWIELFAIGGLAVLVLLMLWQGRGAGQMIPAISLFAAAAFRMMPSLYRALGAVQNLPYGGPVVTTLRQELSLPSAVVASHDSGVRIRFEHEIRLVDVRFVYPDAELPTLDGASLVIRRGDSVGIVGPSGSGKSTLVDVVLGLLTPTAGQVLVDGVDIQRNLRAWQDQIGYVPQSVYLVDDSVRANVAFGLPAGRVDAEAVDRAIRAAQLDDFIAGLPAGLDTVVGERGVRLSGGQRQRIGIARALYHDPPVIVLDEATSALDAATELGVLDAVRALQGSKTLLIVAHRLSTVVHCARLLRVQDGRIIEDAASASVPDPRPSA